MIEQQSLIPISSGEELRHRRESLKLPLAVAARDLKCSIEVLEAIETDQPINLPPIYLRGFLKGYARLLDLDSADSDALLERYEPVKPSVQSIFPEHMAQPTNDRWLRVASYVLASLLVGTLAWQLTHEAVRLANVDGAITGVDSDRQNVSTPLPLGRPVNASIAALESMRSTSGSRTGNAGAQAWNSMGKTASLPPMEEGQFHIEITASADTWVDIVDRTGTQLEQDLMRGGDRRSYIGEGPFQISLGRSSAIQLSLNGRLVDLRPYTRDDVTQMLLEPDTVSFMPIVEPQSDGLQSDGPVESPLGGAPQATENETTLTESAGQP